MIKRNFLILSLSIVALVAAASTSSRMLMILPHAQAAYASEIGSTIKDFTLKDADGKAHNLSGLKGAKGTALIFISTQCPVSNAYNERMEKLATEYKAKGINVIGINSNVAENAQAIKAHAQEKGLTFVILKDEGNKIADALNAQVTPEVFLLDANNKLVYHGRIDDARNEAAIKANDFRDAMDAIIGGTAIKTTQGKAFGCSIKRA